MVGLPTVVVIIALRVPAGLVVGFPPEVSRLTGSNLHLALNRLTIALALSVAGAELAGQPLTGRGRAFTFR